MSIEANTQFSSANTNRKVWVVNNGTQEYQEMFRGDNIVVPPNGEKKVLMPFLAARRFLGQPVVAAEQIQRPDGTFMGVPKMLETIEISIKEAKELFGTDEKKLAKEIKEQEEKAALMCALCGYQTTSPKGLKIHTTKEHPNREPVKEDDSKPVY